MKTVWAYAHVGSNPTLSAKKMFSPSGGNIFCRYTGFESEGKNKAGVVDSCFIVPLRRKRFAGQSAQFLPAPCFRRSLFRFADDAADSLRQSPPHQFRNRSCQTCRCSFRNREADTPMWAPAYHNSENASQTRMAAISITGRARALPINEILLYQCCSHHLTISSTHQQGGSPIPVDAIL